MRDCVASARVGEARLDSDGKHAFQFRFAPTEAVFAGHFPGQPILPGVFQIEMTRQAAEAALGRGLSVAKIVKAKFSRVIEPGELVDLVVRCDTDEKLILARAKLSVGGERAGECRLELIDKQEAGS